MMKFLLVIASNALWVFAALLADRLTGRKLTKLLIRNKIGAVCVALVMLVLTVWWSQKIADGDARQTTAVITNTVEVAAEQIRRETSEIIRLLRSQNEVLEVLVRRREQIDRETEEEGRVSKPEVEK